MHSNQLTRKLSVRRAGIFDNDMISNLVSVPTGPEGYGGKRGEQKCYFSNHYQEDSRDQGRGLSQKPGSAQCPWGEFIKPLGSTRSPESGIIRKWKGPLL